MNITTELVPVHQLAGYTFIEPIYQGTRTMVYRALETATQRSVMIKVIAQEYPSFAELVQFRNQYTVAKNLVISGIVRPLSLEFWGNGYALVMEDTESIDLEQYVQQHSLSLIEILNIAIQLADIIHALHQSRVIHKDIKPANILIHPDTKQVKLIDFSIASLLPRENQTIQSPGTLEGTLAYMAPEQTGRMNRGIDYRTDFYALGVTLYQLLTRQLPFTSNDPLDLIHYHMTQLPKAIDQVNPNVPNMVTKIITKLMAKNAEDRYQNALGLKYDFEQCLNQWSEQGEIAKFALGQRDLSDRFLIPEKLYGRETEVNILLDAFDRVSQSASELILVAGYSGIGKTAVVNEVQKPIVKKRGYFIKGKFDQFNRHVPFSAFVQALRDLVDQLLSENDVQLQNWKTQILEALGENAQVIVDLIPALECVIGSQPPAPELPGTAAQNRFYLLFQRFIQIFAKPDHPLVIFVDDLQWADSASLQVIQVLMGDTNTGHLLLFGAYRDNEVFATHPLMLTLNELRQTVATFQTITLHPLSLGSLNHMVADTLHAPAQVVQPLTALVIQKTQGNPFFATQFLKALHQDQMITFDRDAGHWQCDIVQVRDAALTDDVVKFMALRLQKLPTSTQMILKLAACVGAQFDLETLAIVSEHPSTDVATLLWKALQEGLILPQSEIYKFYFDDAKTPQGHPDVRYRFLHDRVQQAAYSLIPDEQKQITHLKIGRLLRQNDSSQAQENRLFAIVNHLNVGVTLITNPKERESLAELNLAAGRKAKGSTAYSTAIIYLSTGIDLLPETAWDSHYPLTLALHEEMTEVSQLNAEFGQMERWAAVVLCHAKTLLDTIKVQRTRIMGGKAQGQLQESIDLGLQVLKTLEIEFPEQPSQVDIDRAYTMTRSLWAKQSPLRLLNLPAMEDARLLAAIEILMPLGPAAYVASPALLPLLIFKQVELSIKGGNTLASIMAYCDYGLILCGIMGDIPNGFEFGELAASLLEKLQAKALKGRSWYVIHAYIKPWKVSLSDILPALQAAYASGLDTGDIDALGWNAFGYTSYLYHAGRHLAETVDVMELYRQNTTHYNVTFCLPFQEIYQQTVVNLLGQTNIPYELTGKFFDKIVSLPQLKETNQRTALFLWFLNQSILYYLFGKYPEALQATTQTANYLDGGTSMFMVPLHSWFDALIQLAAYATLSTAEEQQSCLSHVQQQQEQLRDWATLAPMNHQHRCELLEAERCRVLENKTEAIENYDRAIISARENGFIQDEALANELAAKFYLAWGKETVAAGYMQEAYYCYSRWGAKAKVTDLETLYPKMLRPILQSSALSGDVLTTLMPLSDAKQTAHTSSHHSSSTTSLHQTLDFAVVLKASQVLSSTIQLDELLRQLVKIILKNSGGDSCTLVLPNIQGDWQVRAFANDKGIHLCTKALVNHSDLPVKLIQYAKNTQKTIVINDLDTELPVIGDYLIKHQPKSLLCLPLRNQGNLIGIVYLKNQLTSGVFTEERIVVLNFLCTQAAISIQNSLLYEELEHSLTQAQTKSQQLTESIALSKGQQRILALIAQGVPLTKILVETALYIESQSRHEAYCSFLLLESGKRLRNGAAPSLPADYNALIDGVSIGPQVGSCGTAAHHKASVTVTDIATDPLWANFQVALEFGLRACASTPILGAKGEVLATLAMYQPQSGQFTLHDRQLMEVATYLARIAIERHQADIERQQLSLQIIQGEKMAVLGNLVAGVAHEVNNPIGFLNGSIQNAKDYVQDLFEYLDTYQSQQPPNEVVQDSAEEIDLTFLLEDLPKLLNSMKAATDRITGISNSLRIFSRTDTESKVSANLHDGLNSTLVILKYRLKANEKRPAIAVIKNYADMPEFRCFPGQLNQVFMNILANAIDMFDEMAQTMDFEALKHNPQKITIQTTNLVEQNAVEIRISDNGQGMSGEVKARIFDSAFTTKDVGKGTGLGLAIAHQIIVDTHGGRLDVQSEVGQGTEFCIRLPL